MKRSLVLAAAFFACFPAAFAESAGGSQFIRVVENAKSARLQTAVTRYEKDGVKLDLIGAIHIADQAYYEKLNELFKGYDVLLFEMVGGEKLGRQEDLKPAEVPEIAEQEIPVADPAKKKQINALRIIYEKAANFLQLASQVDIVDYSAQNFIHADMTADEFSEKQKERGESLLSFALKSDQGHENSPNPLRLVYGLLTGRANIVKLAVIHTMGGVEDQVGALAGDSVIISDRNIRCLEVLDREMAGGEKNIGIFYGAAHFPDMEERLLERGFHQTGRKWLTAWNVAKGRPVKSPVEPTGN